ncbi:MAG: stage III sporulation protein AB [Ruminococcus sp.]|jgi:stage III sporulation protein AB|nr:stage III sporulation protein AB [Ruminococcus sp.]
MKFFFIVILLLAASGAGIYFRNTLSHRMIILRQLRLALDKITVMIKYRSDTLTSIFTALSSDVSLNELTFIRETLVNLEDKSFAESYSEAVDNFKPAGLKSSDREIIKGIGSVLGVSDTEGQISSLLIYEKELEAAFVAAASDVKTKSKLYSSLGLLSGVFIAILLI